MLKILLVAGEQSADNHGATLLEEIKKQADIDVFGIGGDRLKSAGMMLTVHLKEMAFMGIGEVIRHLPFIRKVHKELMDLVQTEKPDFAILIDYPGFNLRMAKSLNKAGIPVIYYISPKIWAWGKGRIKKIKRYVNLMLVLFPFEKKLYDNYRVPVKFVGNPLVDQHHTFLTDGMKNFDSQNARLGILPGSRKQEVTNLLPKMLQVAHELYATGKIHSAEILKVANLPEKLYSEITGEADRFITLAEKPMSKALPEYDVALVASGTATLETGYFGIPMVVVYQVNSLTYWLAKLLVKIKLVGLVNIVAEKEVAKELIQSDFTISAAVYEIEKLLNPDQRTRVVKDLQIVRDNLGPPGASKRAADEVLDFTRTNIVN